MAKFPLKKYGNGPEPEFGNPFRKNSKKQIDKFKKTLKEKLKEEILHEKDNS